ncbi:MAG: recombination mediator RecR [Verrucomicrobiota bacterium]|nr:recombination protein RecR [Opitutae bacterium]MBO25490.1 recombination protein RecR [Opitutales bacterium]MEC7393845.1 recombination mediator RecR [Verrucomicrobiota bacterium]MEC8656061.1 recombination mediator RecR [Verrucomicrobiota bacterium]MEC8778608.1 recombination mediator RecR [Verrucomicrobiota bacterium]
MTPVFEQLVQALKALPGLGYRSAEKIALHILVEKPQKTASLVDLLTSASEKLGACSTCGNLTEEKQCKICLSNERNDESLCVVEGVTDLHAMEQAGVFRGKYHVLHGKLSPIRGIGPEQLNLQTLRSRIDEGSVEEVILALGNDMEGEATCYYIMQEILEGRSLRVSRIGFGLPSGGGLTYADETTLRSAMEGRQTMR